MQRPPIAFALHAGERFSRVHVGPLGIDGDRLVHVEDARGRTVTPRSHSQFLGHEGTPSPQGEPLVEGESWVVLGERLHSKLLSSASADERSGISFEAP